MTLNELAEKKSCGTRPTTPVEAVRLILTTQEPVEETGFEPSQKMQREVKQFAPAQHGPLDRLLETEDKADLIPMDFPTSTPEKLWKEARHAPVSKMCVILSDDGHRAWISLVTPGQMPLLLYMLPVLGRLERNNGVAWEPTPHGILQPLHHLHQEPAPAPMPPIPWQPLPQDPLPPSATSHGPEHNENNWPEYPQITAPGAGFHEQEHWDKVPVFARDTLKPISR